jgi:pSer/pThr/pTyr-binding forkhead associated (FHA) protein
MVLLMDAELIVVGGKASKGSVSLKLPTVIGRSQKATLTVAHPMVSRRHAELFEKDGLLMVRDLKSLNGTRIDGHRIKEAPLPPDAEFAIGPLTFQVKYTYKGDLSKLPAIVPDDEPSREAVETTQAWGESPDFELLDDEPPAKSPAKEKPAKQPSDDPFEDLLNDL